MLLPNRKRINYCLRILVTSHLFPIFTSYTSPDDGGNNIEGNPTAIVTKAIAKLKELEEQLGAAKEGDVVNVIDNDDDDDEEGSSGSGSGSGESGVNEIPENTEKPSPSENDIDDKKEDENTLGGGVGRKPNAGSQGNSASRYAMGEWLLCSLIWMLSLAFTA